MHNPQEQARTVAIAVLQAGMQHSENGNPGMEANWALFSDLARDATKQNPDIIVFPEYAITGWPYPAENEINGIAETIPGDGFWYMRYVKLAIEIGTPILGWMVETEGENLYSTAVLLDELGQFVGKYRKVQANLGEQTWWGWSQGDSFSPIELHGVKYGISICADMWFPETVRCEALLGADIILHQSIADDMQHLVPARAYDSEIPIVMAIFNGGSYAVDAQGELLDKLPAATPTFRMFDLKPFQVRTHAKYGGLWIPRLGTLNLRNPKAYAALTDPATRPAWTDVFLAEDGSPQTREELLLRFSGRYDATDPILYHQEMVSFAPPWTSPYRVDSDYPHQLVNDEGDHLFILNKTAWAYFACENPLDVIERAKRQGVNVLRVALEGAPYYEQLGMDMWPWGGTRADPKWCCFNKNYWDRVEERIRLAGEHGLGLDIVLYFTLHPTKEDIVQQRPYWQYTLERLSRYANVLTWEIANEYIANEIFQDAAGTYIHQHDVRRHPVCTSDGTTDDAVWPDKVWVDLAINHSCTSSTEQHSLEDWYLALARNTRSHGKPAWCNESGREKRHRNDDGVHRRKQGWLWCAAGAFWTWHSWDGCEGIDEQTYYAPGQEFTEPMAHFFQSQPFWKMSPSLTTFGTADERLVHAALVTPSHNQCIIYCCTKASGTTVDKSSATLRLPNGTYTVIFQRPSDLETIKVADVVSKGLGNMTHIHLPTFSDDLIITVHLETSQERTLITGTT